MNIRNPWFPGQANTWKVNQTFNSGIVVGWVGGFAAIDFPTTTSSNISFGGNVSFGYAYASRNWVQNAVSGDIVLRNENNRILVGSVVGNAGFGIEVGLTPVASSPTIASGTIYQNTSASYQTLMIPITYNPTSTAAATCAVALGTSATPATFATETEPATLTAGRVRTFALRVPPQWYYSFTVTDATLGTPFLIQE